MHASIHPVYRRHRLRLCLWAILVGALCMAGPGGCTSKAKARKQARAAFEAGRLQEQSVQAQRQQTLMIQGKVRQPVVPWAPGLTLSRAIGMAQYLSPFPPHTITVRRAGVIHMVDMDGWRRGTEDPLVMPGDLVELF